MASPAAFPSKAHILSTYRSLLRSGLKAVQYSSPAKFAIQQKLRTAFEKPIVDGKNEFNQSAIDNTMEFLDRAAASLGMEHKIVKNLCAVHVFQHRTSERPKQKADRDLMTTFYDEYYDAIKLLNKSMNLELR